MRTLTVALFVTFCFAALCIGSLTAAPVPKAKPATVTYKFKATVTEAEGGPFEKGKSITGQFTYDLKAERKRTDKTEGGTVTGGRFLSEHNRIAFSYGDLHFESTGEVWVGVNSTPEGSDFGTTAKEWKLPKGWELKNPGVSSYCGLQFGSTAKGLINPQKMPEKLKLFDFDLSSTFIIQLVQLSIQGTKTSIRLNAKIESLEEVK